MTIRFKDWHSFHNYKSHGKLKDNPPWIYLRGAWILQEPYCDMTDAELGQLFRLFCFAMQTGNNIPESLPEKYCTEPFDLKRFETFCSGFENVSSRGDKIREEERRVQPAAPVARPALAAKKPRQVGGLEGEVLRAFDDFHQRELQIRYSCSFSRDITALRRALKTYPLPLLLEITDAFWREIHAARNGGGTYIGKATPTICGMIGQIPNLLRDYTFDNLGSDSGKAQG